MERPAYNTILGIFSKDAQYLVRNGIIHVDFHITCDGMEVYARCCNPHPRLGISSNESFEVEELASRLGKLVPEANKKASPVQAESSRGRPVERDTAEIRCLADAQSLAKREDLRSIKTESGIDNIQPADSLNRHDLLSNTNRLQARAFLVADKIGHARLVSKIQASQYLKVRGVGGLNGWWAGSSPQQKWTLLTNHKKAGDPPKETVCRLDLLLAPFQVPEADRLVISRSPTPTSGDEEGGASL